MFQSTLPRGERPRYFVNPLLYKAFQSTLPRGERRAHAPRRSSSIIVSIHAPAWGATLSALSSTATPCGFNPRSRVGSDGRRYRSTPDSVKFQSTLPRGERRKRVCSVVGRTHVSIHAPAWGATYPVAIMIAGGAVSIHAPAWGATIGEVGHRVQLRRFNPRSRVGSDRKTSSHIVRRSSFNPRSRVGSDSEVGPTYFVSS